MAHATREQWLATAITAARQHAAFPQAIRAACGFPSTYTRSGTLSESWPDTSSGDGTWEILISPTVAQPEVVLALLLGELAHSLPGAASTGSQTYRAAVTDLGLMPLDDGYRVIGRGPDFVDMWQYLLDDLGPYPHAPILAGVKAKQTTRMIKLVCPGCGYTIRTTRKWLITGMPICHDGTQFVTDDNEHNEQE
jgi:hypothetical protein